MLYSMMKVVVADLMVSQPYKKEASNFLEQLTGR